MPLHHKLYTRASGVAGAMETFAFEGVSGGLASLPSTLLINSQSVAARYWYQAADATTGSWTTTIGAGGTLTGGGSGGLAGLDTPTPALADRGIQLQSTRHYTSAVTDDTTSEDLAIEVVLRVDPVAGGIANNMTPGQVGWGVRHDTIGRFKLRLSDGVTSANTFSAVGAAEDYSYVHAMIFADRSGFAQWYVDGVASGAQANISGVGALSQTNAFRLGSDDNADGVPLPGILAHFAMWRQDTWLDTHLQAAVALERYARVAGIFNMAATLQSNRRASSAYMRKVSDADGIERLHHVATGWHRYTRATDKFSRTSTGYESWEARTNLCLQSEDLSTTWGLVDAGDIIGGSFTTPVPGRAANTTVGVIGNITNGPHGVSQAITLTAAAYTASGFWSPGDQPGMLFDNTTIANGRVWFSAGGVGTTEAGITAATLEYLGANIYYWRATWTGTAAAHTLELQPAEADNDEGYLADGVSVNGYFWGTQVELGAMPSSYIPTLGTTATRAADDIEYDPSGLTLTQGTLVAELLQPNAVPDTSRHLVNVNDGSASNRIALLNDPTTGGDTAGMFITDGAAAQAAITDTTTTLDTDTWTDVRGTWQANEVRVYAGGTEEGTADLAATIPTGLTGLNIGVRWDGTGHLNGIVRPRILDIPTGNTFDFGAIMAYGEMYWDDFPNATGVNLTAGVPQKVPGSTALGEAADFDMPVDGRLRYTGSTTKKFRVECSITGNNTGAANETFRNIVYKNGVALQKSTNERRINTSNIGSQTISVTTELAQNDYVELWVVDDGSEDFTLSYGNIGVFEVS